MNEHLEEKLARRTKSLRDALATAERDANNNRNAADILNGFINSGQAYQDPSNGSVILRGSPNKVGNQADVEFDI